MAGFGDGSKEGGEPTARATVSVCFVLGWEREWMGGREGVEEEFPLCVWLFLSGCLNHDTSYKRTS